MSRNCFGDGVDVVDSLLVGDGVGLCQCRCWIVKIVGAEIVGV